MKDIKKIAKKVSSKVKKQAKQIYPIEDAFSNGYYCAIQNFVYYDNNTVIASMVLRDSGISKDDCIRFQIESGFQEEKMAIVIKETFKK